MTGSPQPPHSLESERSVLGSILLKPSVYPDVAHGLTVDDFFLPVHREIFAVLTELDHRKVPIDIVALEDELKVRGVLQRLDGGHDFLIKLASEVPTSENVHSYIRMVQDKAMLRRLVAVAAAIQQKAMAAAEPADKLVEFASQVIYRVTERQIDDFENVSQFVGAASDDIEQRGKRENLGAGVRTGLHEFDCRTGGIRPGEMLVIGARASLGKTALACNLARHVAVDGQGTALMFSLEMGKLELLDRFFADLAKVDTRTLRRGSLSTQDWQRVFGAIGRLNRSGLYIADQTYTLDRIRIQGRRWRARHPDRQGILVVDYLQLASEGSGARDDGNRAQQVARISRGLKLLAKELKVPIVALSQLNRESDKENREPRLSDLRESGGIEQDADIVLLLHGQRPEEAAKKFPPVAQVDPGEITAILAKNRGGSTGNFALGWEPQFSRFSNLSTEQEVEQRLLPVSR